MKRLNTYIVLAIFLVVSVGFMPYGVAGSDNKADHKRNDQSSRIAKIEAAIKALHQELEELERTPGPQGPPGLQGPPGADGADAPDRTADLCALYQQLYDMSLIGALEVPDYCPPPTGIRYAIGDAGPAGGIVFYITHGGLHGLEAAPLDQGNTQQWGCQGTAIDEASGVAVGTGAQNTAAILAGCSTLDIAASIAHDYTLNGFNDWFLPSKDELNELYLQKNTVGGFANDYYWCSTETTHSVAQVQHLGTGDQGDSEKSNIWRVRAIRAF